MQSLWKQYKKFLKTLKMELSCDPATHFWIYIQKNCNQDVKKRSALLSLLQIYNSQDIEAT